EGGGGGGRGGGGRGGGGGGGRTGAGGGGALGGWSADTSRGAGAPCARDRSSRWGDSEAQRRDRGGTLLPSLRGRRRRLSSEPATGSVTGACAPATSRAPGSRQAPGGECHRAARSH